VVWRGLQAAYRDSVGEGKPMQVRLLWMLLTVVVIGMTSVPARGATEPPVVRFSSKFQSLEVSHDNLVFLAVIQRVGKAPTVRRWSFYRSTGGGIDTIASGDFAAGDLRVRPDRIVMSVPGYAATCVVTEQTLRFTNEIPRQKRTLRSHDGEPELFFESSERTTDYVNLACALETPDMGVLLDGLGIHQKGFLRQRYNDEL